MHPNGSNKKAHTNKRSSYQSHHCRDSGELDVFEASRYFSVDIDELSFGFERLSCSHAQGFPPEKPNNEMKLKDKKHKTRTSSPPSRLASYIISFILQRNPKSVVHEERLRRRKRRNNISSFYSCGTCGLEESEVCEDKKVIDLNCKVGRTKSLDHQRFNENHDEHKVLSRAKSGLPFENKYVLNKRKDGFGDDNIKFKGIRRSFSKDDDDDDDDLESDSSSDLFELSNIDANFHVAQSEEPQVCGGSVKWSLST